MPTHKENLGFIAYFFTLIANLGPISSRKLVVAHLGAEMFSASEKKVADFAKMCYAAYVVSLQAKLRPAEILEKMTFEQASDFLAAHEKLYKKFGVHQQTVVHAALDTKSINAGIESHTIPYSTILKDIEGKEDAVAKKRATPKKKTASKTKKAGRGSSAKKVAKKSSRSSTKKAPVKKAVAKAKRGSSRGSAKKVATKKTATASPKKESVKIRPIKSMTCANSTLAELKALAARKGIDVAGMKKEEICRKFKIPAK